MLTRMQYGILQTCGKNIAVLLTEMQGEAELFASANTLLQVEANLLAIAQTLAHLPETLRRRLLHIDWHGWACLQTLLERNIQPRRAEVWYGTQALAPATLALFAKLRRQEPIWFEIGY
jgi:xanthine/CO dehydrogenase XdhC/CoxF family maturation factor